MAIAALVLLALSTTANGLRINRVEPTVDHDKDQQSAKKLASHMKTWPQPPAWAMLDPNFMAIRSKMTTDVVKLLQDQNYKLMSDGPANTKDAYSYMLNHTLSDMKMVHFIDGDMLQAAFSSALPGQADPELQKKMKRRFTRYLLQMPSVTASMIAPTNPTAAHFVRSQMRNAIFSMKTPKTQQKAEGEFETQKKVGEQFDHEDEHKGDNGPDFAEAGFEKEKECVTKVSMNNPLHEMAMTCKGFTLTVPNWAEADKSLEALEACYSAACEVDCPDVNCETVCAQVDDEEATGMAVDIMIQPMEDVPAVPMKAHIDCLVEEMWPVDLP